MSRPWQEQYTTKSASKPFLLHEKRSCEFFQSPFHHVRPHSGNRMLSAGSGSGLFLLCLSLRVPCPHARQAASGKAGYDQEEP